MEHNTPGGCQVAASDPKNKAAITQARLHELLSYEPTTGVFTNRVGRSSRAIAGAVTGSPDAYGYLQIKLDGKNYKAHRLAWLYVTGAWPKWSIDHLNGKLDDNKFSNLRDATPRVNAQNVQCARIDSGTGLLGASFDSQRGKYLAQISINGRKKNLGRYETAEEAHQVHIAAKRIHHEGNQL